MSVESNNEKEEIRIKNVSIRDYYSNVNIQWDGGGGRLSVGRVLAEVSLTVGAAMLGVHAGVHTERDEAAAKSTSVMSNINR